MIFINRIERMIFLVFAAARYALIAQSVAIGVFPVRIR